MAKKEKPPRGIAKKTDLRENIGKVFINLGQVVFGTLFLGGVLRGEIPHFIMIVAGGISAMLLLVFGIMFSVKEQKAKEG
uniref:Uncharacterized protein n=1 Tax=uncultured bacterium contig00019 TaxID=1181510 RepID=A0A806KE67_9BACT|nr:hypothetical protein [uncultured bacterium contig00019]